MPKLINSVPKYRRHKQSGQAIVTLNGRDYLLGPCGTKASKVKYDRLVAEWLARDRQPLVDAGAGLNVAELASRYWLYATKKHVRNGEPTAEQFKIKTALKHLLRLYEQHPAAEFAPPHLKVVRQSMIDAGWSRNYVNSQVAVLVRMFKWGVCEGLVPAAVHTALALVNGLRRGESTARETSKIRGVDDATVQATLPYLSPIVRAMIELQLATGCRPGELVILKPGDVNREGEIWEYDAGRAQDAAPRPRPRYLHRAEGAGHLAAVSAEGRRRLLLLSQRVCRVAPQPAARSPQDAVVVRQRAWLQSQTPAEALATGQV